MKHPIHPGNEGFFTKTMAIQSDVVFNLPFFLNLLVGQVHKVPRVAGGLGVVFECKGKQHVSVKCYVILGILAHLLILVMKPKYLAFRFGDDISTPISSFDVR